MLKKKQWVLTTILFTFIFIFLLALSTPSHATETIDRGKIMFDTYCIHCHGASGGGDGPAAEELNPKPRNFQDSDEMRSVTPEKMERAIVEGRPGTAMQGWSTILKPEEVKDLIEYIKSLMKADN